MKKMNFLLVFVILISLSSTPTFASNTNSELCWVGNVYYESKITSENNQKAKFTEISLNIYGDTIVLTGKIKYDGNEYPLDISGKIFQPQIKYYGNNKVVGKLSNNNVFRTLSFSIENAAKEEFLLKPNKKLKGKMVVRLALLNKNSNDILYFENDLKKQFAFADVERGSTKLIMREGDFDSNKLYEDIRSIDQWYIPFLPKSEVKPNKETTPENAVQKFDEELESSNILIMFVTADDPLPPVPRSVFTTAGTDYKDTVWNGYYKETNEWPAGSGNLITYFIRWDINDYCPVSGNNQAYMHLSVQYNNQYHYNSSTNKVTLFDTWNPMRIHNIKMSMYTSQANDDFFYQRSFTGNTNANYFGAGNVVKALFAALPWTSNYYYAFSELTSDSPSEQNIDGSLRVWGDTRYEQEMDMGGKVIRDVSGNCEKRNIQDETQYLYLNSMVQDEGDADKRLDYHLSFSIYTKDIWGAYTVNAHSPNLYYYRTYNR